jgi:hypothetical protein
VSCTVTRTLPPESQLRQNKKRAGPRSPDFIADAGLTPELRRAGTKPNATAEAIVSATLNMSNRVSMRNSGSWTISHDM